MLILTWNEGMLSEQREITVPTVGGGITEGRYGKVTLRQRMHQLVSSYSLVNIQFCESSVTEVLMIGFQHSQTLTHSVELHSCTFVKLDPCKRWKDARTEREFAPSDG